MHTLYGGGRNYVDLFIFVRSRVCPKYARSNWIAIVVLNFAMNDSIWASSSTRVIRFRAACTSHYRATQEFRLFWQVVGSFGCCMPSVYYIDVRAKYPHSSYSGVLVGTISAHSRPGIRRIWIEQIFVRMEFIHLNTSLLSLLWPAWCSFVYVAAGKAGCIGNMCITPCMLARARKAGVRKSDFRNRWHSRAPNGIQFRSEEFRCVSGRRTSIHTCQHTICLRCTNKQTAYYPDGIHIDDKNWPNWGLISHQHHIELIQCWVGLFNRKKNMFPLPSQSTKSLGTSAIHQMARLRKSVEIAFHWLNLHSM